MVNKWSFFHCFLYTEIKTDMKKTVVFSWFYFFRIFRWISTILCFLWSEGAKQLMPYVPILLFSCRKCSHFLEQDFKLQAWCRMEFGRFYIKCFVISRAKFSRGYCLSLQLRRDQEGVSSSVGKDTSGSKSIVVKRWKRLSRKDHWFQKSPFY